MKKRNVLLTVIVFAIAINLIVFAEQEKQEKKVVVFTGIPTIKISEGGVSRVPEKLSKDKAIESKCSILQIGDNFYWATRENIQMVRIESGAFTTFIAMNGSGYVRIINTEMKEAASLMGETEKQFDYVEHLLIGLKSITYYGGSSE